MQHLHGLRTHPQLVGDDLGKGGFRPLTVGRDFCVHVDLASWLDAYQCMALLHLATAARRFHDGGQTHAEEWFLNTPALLGLAHAGIVGQLQRLLQSWHKIAGIVGQSCRCGIGKGIGWDKIAAPDLGRIEPQFASQKVNGALHEKGALGASGAPVRPGGRFIGQHAQALDVHGMNGVRSSDSVRGVDWWSRAGI